MFVFCIWCTILKRTCVYQKFSRKKSTICLKLRCSLTKRRLHIFWPKFEPGLGNHWCSWIAGLRKFEENAIIATLHLFLKIRVTKCASNFPCATQATPWAWSMANTAEFKMSVEPRQWSKRVRYKWNEIDGTISDDLIRLKYEGMLLSGCISYTVPIVEK